MLRGNIRFFLLQFESGALKCSKAHATVCSSSSPIAYTGTAVVLSLQYYTEGTAHYRMSHCMQY